MFIINHVIKSSCRTFLRVPASLILPGLVRAGTGSVTSEVFPTPALFWARTRNTYFSPSFRFAICKITEKKQVAHQLLPRVYMNVSENRSPWWTSSPQPCCWLLSTPLQVPLLPWCPRSTRRLSCGPGTRVVSIATPESHFALLLAADHEEVLWGQAGRLKHIWRLKTHHTCTQKQKRVYYPLFIYFTLFKQHKWINTYLFT